MYTHMIVCEKGGIRLYTNICQAHLHIDQEKSSEEYTVDREGE